MRTIHSDPKPEFSEKENVPGNWVKTFAAGLGLQAKIYGWWGEDCIYFVGHRLSKPNANIHKGY